LSSKRNSTSKYMPHYGVRQWIRDRKKAGITIQPALWTGKLTMSNPIIKMNLDEPSDTNTN